MNNSPREEQIISETAEATPALTQAEELRRRFQSVGYKILNHNGMELADDGENLRMIKQAA